MTNKSKQQQQQFGSKSVVIKKSQESENKLEINESLQCQGYNNISTVNMNQEYIPFETKYLYEKRCQWSNDAMFKFPTKIPIIIEQSNVNPGRRSYFFWTAPMIYQLPQIQNPKFIVPKSMTMKDIQYIVKQKIGIDSKDNLTLVVNKKILLPEEIIINIYDNYKSSDGFLYLKYMKEETFG